MVVAVKVGRGVGLKVASGVSLATTDGVNARATWVSSMLAEFAVNAITVGR
jgi:hypothetical protein